jgi:TRAP-type C4-dicarboxylate transport system permease small subunit
MSTSAPLGQPKDTAQRKDSKGYTIPLGGLFLALALAGVACIVGLVFGRDGASTSMPLWTLKTALALFSGSVVLGWIFHMNVMVKINKGDFHNVYRGAQRWLLALQILCCLAGVGLLIIFSFGAIRPPYEQTAPALAPNSNWRPTGRGTTRGISGLALLQQERGSVSFLAVLDNKRADEPRLMRLTARAGQAPQSQDLAWPGLYHLRAIDQANAVELLGESDLLNAAETPEIEAFDLQYVGPHLMAIWAARGDGPTAAVLSWGKFDPWQRNVQDVQKAEFRTPWPQQSARHISDLRVDANGNVLVVSTSDPGDDGPFESAAYVAGTLRAHNSSVRFELNSSPVRLRVLEKHKAEAIELLPGASGGLVFGADNENHGGAILYEP